MSEPQQIYTAIAQVKKQVGPVARDKTAGSGGFAFKYRGIEDVYDAVQRVFAEHGVFSVPQVIECEFSETASGNRVNTRCRMKVKHTFYAADGSSVSTEMIGEGLDSGDKASGKAMTVSHRHAICQLLMLPFAAVEPEDDQHEAPEVHVTLDQIKGLKNQWWKLHKGECGNLDKNEITAKFAGWARDAVHDVFDPQRIVEWQKGWYEQCQSTLEEERRAAQNRAKTASESDSQEKQSPSKGKGDPTSQTSGNSQSPKQPPSEPSDAGSKSSSTNTGSKKPS